MFRPTHQLAGVASGTRYLACHCSPQDPSATQDPARQMAVGAPTNPDRQAPEQVRPWPAGTVQLKGKAFPTTTVGCVRHVPAIANRVLWSEDEAGAARPDTCKGTVCCRQASEHRTQDRT